MGLNYSHLVVKGRSSIVRKLRHNMAKPVRFLNLCRFSFKAKGIQLKMTSNPEHFKVIKSSRAVAFG